MPRKKRTIAQNEGQRKVCRTEEENDDNKDEDTLVISDSENEEEESSVSNMSQRESRWRGRENRSQMQDMTEEEMLDLAMRLSKQEANNAAQRQQLEDDDIRKAIAQSLHVSQSQALEVKPESTSSAAETHQRQDPTTVKTHWRRKLSYPTKCEKSRTVDNEDAAAAESGKDTMQYISALSPMPDLSQRTLSQPSPPSPGLPSVPTTASQECHSIQWKNQDVNAGSPEDEPSQSSSQGQRSPAFLKKCSIRLDTKSTSRASRNLLSTQDSSLSLTCPSRSQLTQEQSSSAHKSPVFAKTDPKGSTAFSKDEISCCASKDNFTDERCTPKEEDDTENLKESSSHKQLQKSRNPRQRLSLHGKPQLLHNSVPGDDGDDVQKQEAVQTKHLKDDSSKGSHLNASLDSEPLEEFTSHMFLHLSEDDVDDDDEEEERGVQPSPVFRKEIVLHSGRSRLSPTQPCCSPANAITTKGCSNTLGYSTKDSGSQHACLPRESTTKPTCPAESDQQPECSIQEKPTSDFRESKAEGLVSYYWGVPFCPRGQSPDDYTRVILSQLEVYEKSLKEAQHHLLHKAEWSLPLLPCPAERPFGRRMKRHRALQLRDEKEDEDEELEKKAEEKKKEAVGEERAASPAGSEEGAENGQNETYVVVSSPETQEELVQISPLRNPHCLMQHGSLDAVGPSSCRKTRPLNISEDQNQQPSERKEGQNENYDVGGTVSQESQASDDNTPELMVTSPAQPLSRGESEVMEVDKEVAAEDEERMEQEQAEEWQQQLRESVPPQIQTVECPLCSRLFPVSKIEVHAAFCDGTTEDQEQQSDLSQVVALRKRTRRIPVEDNLQISENTSEQREKCYKCQRYFTSKDFSHHVEKCLQLTGPRSHQGNGLLSALHQAEQVHLDVDTDGAGPSDIKNKNQGGLRDSSAGNASSSTSSLYFSSSPIKSFTPISEASDCLIDFQQQYSAKSSQRLGRKRKFKR